MAFSWLFALHASVARKEGCESSLLIGFDLVNSASFPES
jgi:hypothetical protein